MPLLIDALLRHARVYESVLRQTDSLFIQGGESVLPALKTFDFDWQNIQLGQTNAKKFVHRNRQWLQLSCDYPDAGVNILHLRINPMERIHWLESGLVAAKELGDIKMEGTHLGSLGIAYLDIGNSKRAIGFGKQQLKCARKKATRLDEALALGNIASAYYQLNDFHKAINYYQKALSIFRSLDDYSGEGLTLQGLGISYFRLGDKEQAMNFLEQHQQIALEHGDRQGEAAALQNIGIIYRSLGETNKAAELINKRLTIAREIGDRRGEGNALHGIGRIHADLEEFEEAIDYYLRAISLYESNGFQIMQAICLWNLSLVYDRNGNREQAITTAESAHNLRLALGDIQGAEKVRSKLVTWKTNG